jgi:DNA-binding transcriptional MerR regulator
LKSLSQQYRIGAIAKLAGVPVTTLRVWEARHQAFRPIKTAGQHRLYGEEDLLRATLLKQLSDQGYAISTIASLDIAALNDLMHKQNSQNSSLAKLASNRNVSLAIVGLALAGQVESKAFSAHLQNIQLVTTGVYQSLEMVRQTPPSIAPDIFLLKINTLHEIVVHEILQAARAMRASKIVVLYNYGREQVVRSMRDYRMMVRREPLSDYELAELINSVLVVDAGQELSETTTSVTIPARKYSDYVLKKISGISTNVLCECPRHVAEIIAQLASFEQYSQECLNKSTEDAHLHAYLSSVSGSARALFEQALEKVASHEGIDLNAHE